MTNELHYMEYTCNHYGDNVKMTFRYKSCI